MNYVLSAALEAKLRSLATQQQRSIDALLHEIVDHAESTTPYHTERPALELLARFFDLSLDMLSISNRDGYFVQVNPAFVSNLGYPRETLLQTPFITFVHPDDITDTRRVMGQLLRGEPVTEFENRYRHADGTYRWLSWASIAEGDNIFAVARDITDRKALEEALREQTEQISIILESIADAFCAVDNADCFTYVNAEAERLLRRPAHELLGRNALELFPDTVGTVFHKRYQQVLAEGVPGSFREYFVPLDIWLEVRIYPHADGVSVYFRDVSEQYHAEQARQESEARYQAIINSQIDLICRYTPDTRLTFVNDAYCAFFGKSREELLGKSFLPLSTPDQYKHIEAAIDSMRSNPVPRVNEFYSVLERGEVRWIQWVDQGIVDAGGALVEIQTVGRDITRQKQAEADLRERTELLQTVIDNIPVLIALVDENRRFEMVNRHWIDKLGWTVEEIRQHDDILREFYPDPEVRSQAREYMQAGRSGWREFETLAKDGTVLDIAWANVRLSDGASIGIGQDISERKLLDAHRLYTQALEIELIKERELSELKERFTSMVSHEFRTPLTVILSSASFIQHYYDRLDKARIMRNVGLIINHVGSMTHLLDEVLTIAKGHAHKLTLNPEPVAIVSFCEQILNNAQVIDESPQMFIFQPEIAEETIYADPRLLTQIFSNLLSNAIKYSPPNGTIRFSIRRQGSDLTFLIQDQGIGIPVEDQTRIFDEFHRATNTQNVRGTGLGLAVVRQALDAHGGSILFCSQEQQGTTFRVRLPLHPVPPDHSPTS